MSGGFFGFLNPSNILSGTYTVAALPDATQNARKYAWTTDLFGGPGDYVISDGVNWKPVRPLAVLSTAQADLTATTLITPPTILLSGTLALGVTRTIQFSTQYAYGGAKFRTIRKATGGLGTLIVNGLGLGLAAWRDDEYDPVSGTWVQTASGGLL